MDLRKSIYTFFCMFQKVPCFLSKAENFRMVDIEINAWSSLFLNIKPTLILKSVLNSTNQSRVYETDKFEILRAI